MIDRARFDLIKERYGHFSSWAVWAAAGPRPKDNVGDLSIFTDDSILPSLNPDVVLVGLNISRPVEFPMGTFHDRRSQSMDYKLRYALLGTPLWGGYITDIIKDFEQKASGKVMAYLRQHPEFERENILQFGRELEDLGCQNPLIVGFGADAFKVLQRNLGDQMTIRKLPHYSNYIAKEQYREQVMEEIARWG